MKTICKTLALAMAVGALSTPAAATQVFATSYDMRNGDGQAHTGTYNYWDKSYSGLGAVTVDGALLTGGLGDLTNGIVATDRWDHLENAAGTGPYVGWNVGHVKNPVITFHFDPTARIELVRLHVDNTAIGSVRAPDRIFIDGVEQAFTAPALHTWGWIDIAGLNLTGPVHTIQLNQRLFGPWIFLDEVQFNGELVAPPGVPEPAAWALMICGFGAAGAMLRRRGPMFAG